jgi:hypothetical protein
VCVCVCVCVYGRVCTEKAWVKRFVTWGVERTKRSPPIKALQIDGRADQRQTGRYRDNSPGHSGQTDRETYTDRQTDRRTVRHTQKDMGAHVWMLSSRQTNRHKQKNRRADRRRTDRRKDRQTEKQTQKDTAGMYEWSRQDRQTNQIDTMTDGQTDIQTDRQANRRSSRRIIYLSIDAYRLSKAQFIKITCRQAGRQANWRTLCLAILIVLIACTLFLSERLSVSWCAYSMSVHVLDLPFQVCPFMGGLCVPDITSHMSYLSNPCDQSTRFVEGEINLYKLMFRWHRDYAPWGAFSIVCLCAFECVADYHLRIEDICCNGSQVKIKTLVAMFGQALIEHKALYCFVLFCFVF